jgi:hypothetical protein
VGRLCGLEIRLLERLLADTLLAREAERPQRVLHGLAAGRRSPGSGLMSRKRRARSAALSAAPAEAGREYLAQVPRASRDTRE